MITPDSSASSLGIDSRSLDALRREASQNPNGAARQAAVQFESMFMQMVLKSMRDATIKAEDASPGTDTFTGMLDTQMAKQFSGRPNGLADIIERQLSRHMPASSATAADLLAPGAAPPPALAPAAPTPRRGTPQALFLEKMAPHAQAAERATGVPASFILGQAALESGWGKGEIRNADGTPSFNLFGIKATSGWKGGSTNVMTTEYANGSPVKQAARFRSYSSYAEAFADYARLISKSPRYGDVVKTATTAESFASGMQRAGYATDPAYASKLTRTINLALAVQRSMG
ncbi:MAG: flagellar assembly peptidoglycan hydrolase FlgJ [Pseudomonadota bacterium]